MRCKERSGLKYNLWQRREMHGESTRKNGLSGRRRVSKEGGSFFYSWTFVDYRSLLIWRFDFSQEYIPHGYKELCLAPTPDGEVCTCFTWTYGIGFIKCDVTGQLFLCNVTRLFLILHLNAHVRGTAASWLVHLTLDRAVRVQALTGDIVLCSWARHFTLTVPLSTQVYKWLPAK